MRISRGYRECPSGSVQINELRLGDRVFYEALDGVSISDTWSPDQEIGVRLRLAIDLPAIRRHLALLDGDRIIAGVTSYCRATGLRHVGMPVDVNDIEIEVRMTLPPFEVDEQLLIQPVLAVRLQPNQQREIGSPRLDFSRIWEVSLPITLIGSHARANVVAEDFDELPGYEGALWRVMLDAPRELEDLESADHSNVVKVAINARRRSELSTDVARVALATDVATAAIDSFFVAFEEPQSRTAALGLVKDPGKESGSWIRFLRTVMEVALGAGLLDASQAWETGREEARTRLQSHYATNVYGRRKELS